MLIHLGSAAQLRGDAIMIDQGEINSNIAVADPAPPPAAPASPFKAGARKALSRVPMAPALGDASTVSTARTSARADVVLRRAGRAIADYARLVGVAYDEALPLLNRALTATYAAVTDLLKDPTRLVEFLDETQPGPASANPVHPIVRKLWKGVPTRDTIRRYASCIGLAQREGVKPAEFSDWLSGYPGGIKKAAATWSVSQKRPDERIKAARSQIERRDALLSKFQPIRLPAEIGCRQQGLYVGAIRVSAEGNAELLTVLDSLAPAQVAERSKAAHLQSQFDPGKIFFRRLTP
ncbi:MAG: hypothetical protein ACHQK9_01355 [Reyranellales bacterium]